jgi:hypothetical protein
MRAGHAVLRGCGAINLVRRGAAVHPPAVRRALPGAGLTQRAIPL